MNDDPAINEIKQEERLKIEIPVEDETTENNANAANITGEFQKLGRQFAETLQSAWNSDERQRIETEVRSGLRSFADEVDKVIREAKASPTTTRVKEEAVDAKTRVESSEVGQKAREGIAGGLRWLGTELGNIADHFTPAEKPVDGE